MSKIRIKRIKRTAEYEYNRLDTKYVNGIILDFVVVGEPLVIRFDRFGYGTWYTSPIISIKAKKTLVVIKTKNSIYHLKHGWKNEIN